MFISVCGYGQKTLRIGGHEVVPVPNVDSRGVRSVSLGEASGGRNNVLLQFSTPPTEREREQLEQVYGLRLADYLGANAYFGTVRAGAKPSDFRGSGLVSLMPLAPEWKMGLELERGEVPEWARRSKGEAALVIGWFENADWAQVSALLAHEGATVLRYSASLRVAEVVMPVAAAKRVAAQPYIATIQPRSPQVELLNREGRILSGGRFLAQPAALGGRGLTGQGVRVGIWDGNVQQHADYGNRVNVYEYEYGVEASGSHGMHVTGTVAGAGLLDPRARGMAPRATTYNMNFNTQSNGLEAQVEMEMIHKQFGIQLTSNSYGLALGNFCVNKSQLNYGLQSAFYMIDALSIKYPEMLHIFAAGNDQSVCGTWYASSTSRSKNVIYVGAVNANGDLANFSSCGPMDDGRLIPTVCAKGVATYSTVKSNGYKEMDGTSMATPTVTGHTALLIERYHQLHNGEDPSNALLKALICNNAEDRGNPHVDYRYGYGVMDAVASVEALEKENYRLGTLKAGQEPNSFQLVVPDGVEEVRVMLVWMDPSAQKVYSYGDTVLVNNLDLSVVQNGREYLPWSLTPQLPDQPATRKRDKLNPIEQVTIDRPTPGVLTVKVGGEVKMAGGTTRALEQPYAVTWTFVKRGLEILSPLAGDAFAPGQLFLLRTKGFGGKQFTAQITYDGGTRYEAPLHTSLSSIHFQLPKVGFTGFPTNQARIRLIDAYGAVVESDYFTVMEIPDSLVFDGKDCDFSSWTLQWNPCQGAVAYRVLLVNEATGEFEEIGRHTPAEGEAENRQSFKLPAEKLHSTTRNIVALQAIARDKNGKEYYSARSKGVLVKATTPLKLTEAMLPYQEFFRRIPLQYLAYNNPQRIDPNDQTDSKPFYTLEAKETPPSLTQENDGKRGGNYLLALHYNTDTDPKPIELRFDELDLTDFAPNTPIFYSTLIQVYQSEVSKASGSKPPEFQVLAGEVGHTPEVIECTVGDKLIGPSELGRTLLYNLSPYAGKKISLVMRFKAYGNRDALFILYYMFRKLDDSKDIEVSEIYPPAPKSGMQTEKLRFYISNNSKDVVEEVPYIVRVDGTIRQTGKVKRLKPYELRLDSTTLDFSSTQRRGQEFKVEVEAIYPGDVKPSNNKARTSVYNLGQIYTQKKSREFKFIFNMDAIDDPKEKVVVRDSLEFADMGGIYAGYDPGQWSTLQLLPADTLHTIEVVFHNYSMAAGDQINVWSGDVDPELTIDARRNPSTYSLRDDSNGTPFIVLSEAENGGVTIRLESDRNNLSGGKGFFATAYAIPKFNIVRLDSIAPLQPSFPDGKGRFKLQITNLTDRKLENVPVLYHTSGMYEFYTDRVKELPVGGTVWHTLQQPLPMAYPQRILVNAFVDASDPNARDNSDELNFVNDDYPVGSLFGSQRESLNFATLNGKTATLQDNAPIPYIDFRLKERLDLKVGALNHLRLHMNNAVQMTKDPEDDFFPATFYAMIDFDGDKQFTQSDDPSKNEVFTLKQPHIKKEREDQYYTQDFDLDIDLTQRKLDSKRAVRMRIALLKDSQAENFFKNLSPFKEETDPYNPARKKIVYLMQGQCVDITADLLTSSSSFGFDLSLLSLKGLKHSADLGASETISIRVKNVGHNAVARGTVAVTLDGKQLGLETLVLNLQPGEEKEVTLAAKLDLSAVGAHQVEVRLGDDDDLSNNALQRSVYHAPKGQVASLWALKFHGDPAEMLRIPTATLGIENFDERAITIEGWFFHEKVQFATLFDSYDLAVRSYSERSWRRDAQGNPVQLPENGIGISFGNKNYLITTEEGVLRVGEWNHVAIVVDKRSNQDTKAIDITLYVNGEEPRVIGAGEGEPSVNNLVVGKGYTGQVKMIRIWEGRRSLDSIRKTMYSSVRNTSGELPKEAIAEFLFNEGSGAAVLSGEVQADLVSPRIVGGDVQDLWVSANRLIHQVQAMDGQEITLDSRYDESTHTVEVTMAYGQDCFGVKHPDLLPRWGGTNFYYKGQEWSRATDVQFDETTHSAQFVAKRAGLFGQDREEAFTVKLVPDAAKGCELLELAMLKADNDDLKVKSDYSLEVKGHEVMLKPELENPAEAKPKAVIRLMKLSEGATAWLPTGEGDSLRLEANTPVSLDLTSPKLIKVWSANHRFSNYYTFRMGLAQSIVWDAANLSYPLTREAQKLEAKATSELPVRYLLQDNSLATIDPDGYANLLKAGKTTLYADQPGNALFAPAPSKAVDLTVKRAKVEAIPTVPSINEGDPVPAIHFTLKGLLFGESEQQLELPAYQIYHHGATVPVDLTKEQLKAGVYDLKPTAGTPGVVVRGNYEVKLSDGTLTVNAPKAKKLSVTVKDGEGQNVDGATVKVADFTLTTASGKVELRLPASEYTVLASKDGYAADSKKIEMTADVDASVELTLRKADISLTYTAGEHGSVIGYLTQRVAKGDNGQTVVAVPEENYMFDKWEDRPTEKAERTDMNVQANVMAKALFRPAEFTVRYLLDAELGELVGQAEQTVPINTSTAPVTVKPKPGVVFMGWSDGKMDLTRHEEGVKGNLTLTASLCRPFALPYVENFERPTMPEFWRSEDKSPLVDGKKANGKFRIVAKGMADYELRIELDKLVHSKVHAVLISPPIALEGVSNGLTLRYKAGWISSYRWTKPEDKRIGYRFDGKGSWTYADMKGMKEDGKPEDGKLTLEKAALVGKKYVEFCWEIKVLDAPGLLTPVSIDNILVIEGSSTSKQVVRYIAGDHGKVKVGDDAPESTATRFVEQGKMITVTAVPDAEYKLSTWSDGSKEITRTDKVEAALTLQAFFEPDKPHFKLFYTADEHGRIKGMPLQEVVKGEDGRTVVAEPEEASAEDIENAKRQGKELKNYVFKGWSDGKTEQVRTDKNVQADLNVTAHFAPAINIVYEASIGGRVVGELLQVVAEGNSTAEVEAIPEEGYTFAGWDDGKANAKRQDAATKDCTYRALFNRKCRVTFSVVDGEHGSLTAMAGGKAVENGDLLDLHSQLTFTAHPDAGYRVQVWMKATPDADGDINTARAEVLGDLDVKVQFVQYYTLTYASADEAMGYIVGEKRMEIAKGLPAKPVTALPKISYQFSQWNDGLEASTRQERRVDENKDFVASFIPTNPNLVKVTFRVVDSETGNPTKGAAITVGTASQNDSDNGHNGVVIVSLPKGTTAYQAASPGYKPKDSTVDVKDDGQEVAIRLEKEVVKDDKARDITFICTYNGEPVKGVTVELSVPTLGYAPSAITEENGKCVIKDVPVVDGDITWTAKSGNYRTESGKFRLPLPNDEPIAISLTKLSDHGTLVFTCKDRASSAILKGVTITVKDAAGEHKGTTGADGQVKFEDILFGQVDYTAELNGYKKAEGQCPHAADGNAFEVRMEKEGGNPDAVISSLLQEVTVAPNPADSWIRVDNCQNVRHMAVYTSTGARVLEIVCGGQETVTINTALFTPGMYLLQLVASDGGRRSISFVKR